MTLHNFIQVELLESGEGGDDFVYFWGKKTPHVMGANAGIVGDDAVSSQKMLTTTSGCKGIKSHESTFWKVHQKPKVNYFKSQAYHH